MKWTIAVVTAVVVPTLAIAQQPTYGRDTARAQGRERPTQQTPSREDRGVRSEARGEVETPRARRGRGGRTTWGLSTNEIRELQQALQNINCYDAHIDGIIGPRTRAGIPCAMRHHNLTGSDPNELMRALNLNIEVDAKAGLGAIMRSGATNSDRPPAERRDTTGQGLTRDTTDQSGKRDTLRENRPPETPPPIR